MMIMIGKITVWQTGTENN